ncbi:conserved Plasmodium protein, unknown function [Plasmodium knowlesi strain H]|uniref:Uncharacterized protein n=3 Tax=Plasmodium knowlesi TaxID=5850 RepID=A0A5K1UKN2_PLAKH|nr:conserved Plasmodium protein, unknown function [Plasmodium knowlesi strain H]OTN67273.1 Uncharacterized protein PKNOH_S06410700 [Plasmodium knowlesi]CAA9987382.1 conserved Plasmodium protein, unknown function [Plasmodium knowlesi strain H]SBO23323.1 conserved Plasmodium protein, unknown function [Plasmodium knowlesi strain H]SBO24407.1 conserved Plasmodium protein, unknown function [Plasmodium knowlesi strain H]VVS76856.1 conserved Plasmodium protein, unknown function [Plasmodium knowlesi s|eukprot:XP_002258385.1 hypothetical protein, conserved in Plasmodium species [Plasmodium knowlesi strain H]
MTDKICHKLINENIKVLCHEPLGSNESYGKRFNGSFNNSVGVNCSAKCDELCNNINDRLQKIKDIVHLRSAKPNAVLIETLTYIKEYIKEIQKYIDLFNNVIYEENKAYAYVEDIITSLDKQNQNIQKIFHICSKNIVITKNNNELVLQKPQSYSSLSAKFVNKLLSMCKEEGDEQGDNTGGENYPEVGAPNDAPSAVRSATQNLSQSVRQNVTLNECSGQDYIN